MSNTISSTWEGITNLAHVLKHGALNYPSNTALSSVDGTTYNYVELELASRFIATMLQSSGIGTGDRVAILSENSTQWPIAYFGILSTGATTVPILPDFRSSEVKSILEHAEVKSVFVSGKLLSRLDEGLPASVELVINLDNFQVLDTASGKVVFPSDTPEKLEKLELDPDSLPREEPAYEAAPDDLASIIYTSVNASLAASISISGPVGSVKSLALVKPFAAISSRFVV